MKESYVSYEIAHKLKDCGFDWECKDVYPAKLPDNAPFDKTTDATRYFQLTGESLFIQTLYPAPSLSLAQKWLREVKEIDVIVDSNWWEDATVEPSIWHREYDVKVATKDDWDITDFDFDSYESALSAGIDAALKLLTEKL